MAQELWSSLEEEVSRWSEGEGGSRIWQLNWMFNRKKVTFPRKPRELPAYDGTGCLVVIGGGLMGGRRKMEEEVVGTQPKVVSHLRE